MQVRLAVCAFALFSGAAFADPPSKVLTPAEAIAAAEVLPDGAEGIFQFTVKSLGDDDELGATPGPDDPVYLNSDRDRHGATNLSVMIMPAAVKDLANVLGGQPGAVLLGKRVSITGTAQRQKVDLLDASGRPTGKTYLQTRIIVTDSLQLKVK